MSKTTLRVNAASQSDGIWLMMGSEMERVGRGCLGRTGPDQMSTRKSAGFQLGWRNRASVAGGAGRACLQCLQCLSSFA